MQTLVHLYTLIHLPSAPNTTRPALHSQTETRGRIIAKGQSVVSKKPCPWRPEQAVQGEHTAAEAGLVCGVWGGPGPSVVSPPPDPRSLLRGMCLVPLLSHCSLPCAGRWGSAGAVLWQHREPRPLTVSVLCLKEGRGCSGRAGGDWRRAGGSPRPSGISEGPNLWLWHF